jgi:L-lactate permease
LIDTVAFKEVTPFAPYLPSLWSSFVYMMHLVNFLWFWRWVQHSKIYRDIDDAEQVTGKFSKKEIWLVYLDLASMIISAIHLSIVSYVFK